jgi:hypothetical protein
MTMRRGILVDTRGTRETSDGLTKQNIANDKKKLFVKYLIVSNSTYVYVFTGVAALEFQSARRIPDTKTDYILTIIILC